jgi:hypothetical protein
VIWENRYDWTQQRGSILFVHFTVASCKTKNCWGGGACCFWSMRLRICMGNAHLSRRKLIAYRTITSTNNITSIFPLPSSTMQHSWVPKAQIGYIMNNNINKTTH